MVQQDLVLVWNYAEDMVTLLTTILFTTCLSGNCTPGSWCNSLTWQAHLQNHAPCLTLTLWVPGQTLTVATSSYLKLACSNAVCT